MTAISRFTVPALDDLPVDIRERIVAVGERSGFVPNVFVALARRPDEFRAFVAYHDALMERDSGLSKAEREMIVVATSAARSCTYCIVAHGAILRIRAKDTTIADLVAANYRQAPITERQRAMLDYAVKLSLVPEEIGDDDHAALARAGFDAEDVWDISAVVAFFALSNRMAHAIALVPNDEFFSLGRALVARLEERKRKCSRPQVFSRRMWSSTPAWAVMNRAGSGVSLIFERMELWQTSGERGRLTPSPPDVRERRCDWCSSTCQSSLCCLRSERRASRRGCSGQPAGWAMTMVAGTGRDGEV